MMVPEAVEFPCEQGSDGSLSTVAEAELDDGTEPAAVSATEEPNKSAPPQRRVVKGLQAVQSVLRRQVHRSAS